MEAIRDQMLHQYAPLSLRSLAKPTHTQGVTLGVIAAYVVIIAILWNVPYVRMILWPFKVRKHHFYLASPTSRGATVVR